MAKHLIGYLRAYPAAFLITMVSASYWWTESVRAQVLRDPTRPPSTMTNAMPPAGGMPGVGEKGTVPHLQSIIVSSGRKVAVIDGEIVKQGDKVGDAIVAKITESEVTLRTGKDLQILTLFPGLEKRSGSKPANVKSPDKTR